MKLLEFEAKDILRRYGVTTPEGIVARSPQETAEAARRLGGPVFLKAQIGVAGRGRAGGIIPAQNEVEAAELAQKMLGTQIKGLTVSTLLIERRLDIEVQYYLSIVIDRRLRRQVILASGRGGGDIEDLARQAPEMIVRFGVDPLTGLSAAEAEQLAGQIVSSRDVPAFSRITLGLLKAAKENDAELVELNPLVRTREGNLVAADARMIIDDNALFRHPEMGGRITSADEETERESAARTQGFSYVDLSGDIGIVGNGAGLVMATLDLVKHYGGEPANFLDIGGGARVETIKNAVLIVLEKPEVRAVLINILGGITRCDLVAEGLVEALEAAPVKKPIAVRIMGTNEQEGKEILLRHGIGFFSDMESAAEAAVRRSR